MESNHGYVCTYMSIYRMYMCTYDICVYMMYMCVCIWCVYNIYHEYVYICSYDVYVYMMHICVYDMYNMYMFLNIIIYSKYILLLVCYMISELTNRQALPQRRLSGSQHSLVDCHSLSMVSPLWDFLPLFSMFIGVILVQGLV